MICHKNLFCSEYYIDGESMAGHV